MLIDEENYLAHYGILRKSGRYPWGSGGDAETRSRDFLGMVADLKSKGLSDSEIMRGFGMNSTDFRAAKSIANNQKKQADIGMAQKLKDKGYSNVAIGKRMGIGESSVRALLAPGEKDKIDVLQTTSNMLRDQVDKKGFIDIGPGVENYIGVSKTKLATAVKMLEEQGYAVHPILVDQLGTKNKTKIKVLAPPGTTYLDVVKNKDKINLITNYSEDGGRSFPGIQPPLSISSKRIGIRYAEQGGAKADGVIFIRPGVDDVTIGKSRYAQVRIAVDGTHYLKGMAMYKDDLPDGVDLVFNTNKKNTGNKLDAMKKMDVGSDYPFGSIVRQITKPGLDGKPRVVSAMNIVGIKAGMGEEGGWDKWSKTLSSQMLSKQSPRLAQDQLSMAFEHKKNELDDIRSLTNPTVRKHLLAKYADSADSSAVHLKAAHLPRQENKVILPINSLKHDEIYAPTFRNGERVVLVRFPHGGKFEIPELTVNNRHPEGRKLLGDAKDAVGIHSKVAEHLSGADFDGDFVLVIPNNHKKVKSAPPLEGLKGFDPKSAYPAYEGMKPMDAPTKGFQMGNVSNLITDMTIQGAPHSELVRAVRHSMVVIDAEKHNLNWKQSAIDNGISQLKERYQGGKTAGAKTLISKASSPKAVPQRKQGFKINPVTGQKIYTETGANYIRKTVNKKTGEVTEKVIFPTQRSTKLAETDNAHTLSSGTPIEKVYAEHANSLKALANAARKEVVHTKTIPYSPSAKKHYASEVTSLSAKLNIALRNAPLERQAQVLANATYAQKKAANPGLDEDDLKKIKFQELERARNRTGAKKQRIEITDKEWAAIQAGAITNHKLKQILDNTDLDLIKQLATPKSKVLMTSTKRRRATNMLASGYTQAEVADALGVSLSTLKNSIS